MQTSQYLVKGSAVSNLQKYLESKSPGLYLELADEYQLSSGNIILHSSWYDAAKVYKIQDEAAIHLRMTRKEIAIDVARFSLEVDLAGIYRFFMRLGGAEQTLKNSPRIANRYVNFFEITVEACTKGVFRCHLSADPQFMDWSLWSNEGATRGTLHVCNGKVKEFNVLSKSEEPNERNWSSAIFEAIY